MIEVTLMNQLVRQLKISQAMINDIDMSSEKRIRSDQWLKGVKDIERAISIAGDMKAAKYFITEMNRHNT